MANITIQVDDLGNASVITTSQETVSVTTILSPTVTPAPEPPSGWDEQIAEYGRGYNYPQTTAQTVVYRTGDDADIEATIFAPIRVANSLKVQNSLTDFTTLGNTNSFGNTDRFTDSEGLQDYGATGSALTDYKIDHYTGLGWSIKSPLSGTWQNSIDNSLSLVENGFSDYFLPSFNQLNSILDYSLSVRLLQTVTGSIINAHQWTSSNVIAQAGTRAWALIYQGSSWQNHTYATLDRYFSCRKHF